MFPQRHAWHEATYWLGGKTRWPHACRDPTAFPLAAIRQHLQRLLSMCASTVNEEAQQCLPNERLKFIFWDETERSSEGGQAFFLRTRVAPLVSTLGLARAQGCDRRDAHRILSWAPGASLWPRVPGHSCGSPRSWYWLLQTRLPSENTQRVCRVTFNRSYINHTPGMRSWRTMPPPTGESWGASRWDLRVGKAPAWGSCCPC